jgi:hypothetical protein
MTKLSFLAGSLVLLGRGPRREVRDASAHIKRFDDHMLRDIGLSRRDLEDMRRGR